LIPRVRNWLQNQTRTGLFGSAALVQMFEEFNRRIPESLAELGKTEADLDNYRDFQELVYRWLQLKVG
jgi:hypothetical protein